VLGVVFATYYVKRMKTVIILLIMLGIVGTFSRMGFLVAALALLVAPVAQTLASRRGGDVAILKVLGTAMTLVLLSFGAYVAAPQNVQSYLAIRAEDLVTANTPSVSLMGMTSTEERILLFDSALRVYSENYLLGVGAYKAPEFLQLYSGLAKTVHNSYLEALLAGGIFGALAIAFYVTFVALALSKSRRAGGNTNRRSLVLTLLFACGLIGLFLTMNYNSILWLPLVLALADSKLAATSL
jgi:O-antigen ligase